MMNVLFLGHSALSGGAEYCLDTTLRNLDRSRVQPFVIFPSDGPMADRARALDIPTAVMPLAWWMLYQPCLWEWKNRLLSLGSITNLVKLIKKQQIDVVYTNTACLFEGVVAARKAGVPHVTHIHEVLEDAYMRPRLFSLSHIVRSYYYNSRNVVFESTASSEIARKCLKNDAMFQKKTHVVSNSSRFSLADVPEDLPTAKQTAKAELAAQFGLDAGKTWVLWIGRFSERKNPQMLLRAAAQLSPERADFQVLFIGAGPLEDAMRETIEAQNLQACCRIVPFQQDVKPLLTAGDALVLTSNEESFGLVLVEAGMFRLPVIATWVQGPSEILQPNQTGFLVDVDDSAQLTDSLRELLQNTARRQEMGQRNQQRILELYDPKKNTQKLEEILRQSMETTGAGK